MRKVSGIDIFTHLRLCLAAAIHNSKRVKYIWFTIGILFVVIYKHDKCKCPECMYFNFYFRILLKLLDMLFYEAQASTTLQIQKAVSAYLGKK